MMNLEIGWVEVDYSVWYICSRGIQKVCILLPVTTDYRSHTCNNINSIIYVVILTICLLTAFRVF